tara:strand:+ start:1449 stop:1760 length:312 start_codon:yes stop_codon:yes gene_type:complete
MWNSLVPLEDWEIVMRFVLLMAAIIVALKAFVPQARAGIDLKSVDGWLKVFVTATLAMIPVQITDIVSDNKVAGLYAIPILVIALLALIAVKGYDWLYGPMRR